MNLFKIKKIHIFILFSINCIGQSHISNSDIAIKSLSFGRLDPTSMDSNQTNRLLTTPLSIDFKNETLIIGSMYLEESFKEAKLNNDDKTYKLRYNNLNDNFEFKQNEKDLITISKENYTHIKFLDGREFLLKKINIGNETKNVYLEKIRSTNPDYNVNIYKQTKIVFTPSKASNGYSEKIDAEFKKEPTKYFVEVEDNTPILFKKTDDLKKVFPTKKTEIISFIKENKTDMESELYLKKLQEFLSSIL